MRSSSTRSLLLNASYEPLRIVDWKRAVTLVLLNKVEVLEEYSREVRSVSLTVRVPSILRLTKFIRRAPRARVQFSRSSVFARDQNVCQYDGRVYKLVELTIDHVVPRTLGGRSTWDNVVTCCTHCNRKKGGRTPDDAGLKLIRPPTRPAGLGSVLFSSGLRGVPESWHPYLVRGREGTC
jgi:5-methylcytosine-specific restriction endonuclease McrA